MKNNTAIDLLSIDGVVRVDSRIIAKGVNIQHESLMKTVYTYQSELEEFGILRFEIGVLSGPGQRPKYALLNRNQAGVVISLSRNTPQVVRFKVDLFKAIDEMEKGLSSPVQESKAEPFLYVLMYGAHFMRMTAHDDEIWVVFVDLCKALGIDTQYALVVPQEQKRLYTVDTPGGKQSLIHLHPDAVHRFLSNKQQGTSLSIWLAHTAYPTIQNSLLQQTQQTLIGTYKPQSIQEIDWKILRQIFFYEQRHNQSPSAIELHSCIRYGIAMDVMMNRLLVLAMRRDICIQPTSRTIRYSVRQTYFDQEQLTESRESYSA